MEFDLELGDFLGDEASLLEALRDRYASAARGLIGRLRARASAIVTQAVKASPEFVSLLGQGPGDSKFGATLRQHFGIEDPGPVMANVAAAVGDSVLVEYEASRRGLGRLSVLVSRSDYADVLAVPGTSYSSHEYLIDWLNWLLLAGDRVILADTTMIDAKRNWSFSRAGGAVMKKRNPSRKFKGRAYTKVSPIVPWHVPAEWAGTAGENFLTRAIEPAMSSVLSALGEELEAL